MHKHTDTHTHSLIFKKSFYWQEGKNILENQICSESVKPKGKQCLNLVLIPDSSVLMNYGSYFHAYM